MHGAPEKELSQTERRIVRGFAALDLVATAPLATPLTAPWFLDLVQALEALLFGVAALPGFTALHWLFTTLAGTLGVLWAVARLRWPSARLARADAVGRCWVAGLIAWYTLAGDAPRVLLAFVVTELLGAAVQWAVLRERR